MLGGGGGTWTGSTAFATIAFTIIQPDSGTSPTADSTTDTLTLTSANANLTISGNSATDTLTFTIAAAVSFATSVTSPLIIGGSGTTQTLTYKTTTGVGATGADHIFQVGNNGATEAMRILNSGFVGIGTASPVNTLHIAASAAVGLTLERASTNASSADIDIYKARGELGALTIVAASDVLGNLRFSGYDGTTYQQAAGIRAVVDGTPGASDMPGALLFMTAADGSATLTERVRIDCSGNVGIGTASPTAKIHIAGNTSAAAWTTAGIVFRSQSAVTYTDTSSSGTIAESCAISMGRPDFASTNAVTITDASTLRIANTPSSGTNTTITNAWALYVANGNSYHNGSLMITTSAATTPQSQLDVGLTTGGVITLSRRDTAVVSADTIGKIQFWSNDADLTTQNIFANIEVQAAQNITTDAAAADMLFRVTGTSAGGSPAEVLRLKSAGNIVVPSTVTAGGTTGNQTINKASGTVNFAAGTSTLTVTNSLVATTSIVFAVVRTNDATATLKNVVPASGSFVITLTATATAETSVGFFVLN